MSARERRDRPRVLLLWPGGIFTGGANFGVPQLLGIAAAVRAAADAHVEIVDLDQEAALGPFDLGALARRGWDLVGISCYSSYDYLKVAEIARRIRAELPRAWIVAGGYHASARPDDFTREDSPFDFVVVGDGEGPMARLASALDTGRRPLVRVLGPEPTPKPGELGSYDWTLLDRYRPTARRVSSQAEIYLSRGCPYDCAFCMERAKRDTSWRSLEPEQALEEMHGLDRYLDLSDWTLFVADALFGMKRPWRRAFLEGLARRPVRARKVWLLIRLDLVEREDLELMARANVAPGFGLESGDEAQLRRIRKTGKLDGYLNHMLDIARWARELDVPWGANVIVGHPGETEATMRTSARYLERLFSEGTTGFLSVDPFRLYPGSPIDEERAAWEGATGMRVHRYPWWHDGDQELLSEWVDPSASLDFRRCHELRHELFPPILARIKERYAYGGPARDYFMRAVDEQLALVAPERRLHTLGLWHLWKGLLDGAPRAERQRALRGDAELAAAARGARDRALPSEIAYREVLVETPRERFVPEDRIAESAADRAVALTDDHRSTVSAMHAYAAAFEALALAPGDAVADLGGGTGYGAALASRIVGEAGSVLTIEIVEALSQEARALTAELANVKTLCADAHDVRNWEGAEKVVVGFEMDAIPAAWIAALAPGGKLVAPIRGRLTLLEKNARGDVRDERLGPVRYVRDRSSAVEVR